MNITATEIKEREKNMRFPEHAYIQKFLEDFVKKLERNDIPPVTYVVNNKLIPTSE